MYKNNILNKVKFCIDDYSLIKNGQTIIVGLSGGPDSIFLLHILLNFKEEFNLTIIAAHLDHGWRKNSSEDLDFCKKISKHYNVDLVSEHASNIVGIKQNGSLEEYGRLLRRSFFKDISSQYNNSVIALGHHKDDQRETFLIRLFRGAGISGLSGIKPKNKNYIRPLLYCNKAGILNYLNENNIEYLIDETNKSDSFLRNKIRNNVIPELKKCDGRFEGSLDRVVNNLQEADNFIIEYVSRIFNEITISIDGVLYINIELFFKQHFYIQKKILLYWLIYNNVSFIPSQSLFAEIIRFFKNIKSKKHTFYATWSIIKHKKHATIVIL